MYRIEEAERQEEVDHVDNVDCVRSVEYLYAYDIRRFVVALEGLLGQWCMQSTGTYLEGEEQA